MKDIMFYYGKQDVRTCLIDNEPWFCVSDVGKILELKDPHRQARRLPENGRTICPTPTPGGTQDIIYVNEKSLYRLIFRSNKDEAVRFQDWVYDEVLPSIRKTGKYSIPQKLKEKSTNDRNILTDAWKECGIEKPHHFIQLTLQEYKALGIKKGKKKKEFSRKEILLLSALESMENLKLFEAGEKDYYTCRDSLHTTANQIESTKQIG